MQTFLLSSLRPVIWENPLYVRDWVPAVLNAALSSDTQFLASQLVMDYSLLVGIDDNSNQLIVGVIGKAPTPPYPHPSAPDPDGTLNTR